MTMIGRLPAAGLAALIVTAAGLAVSGCAHSGAGEANGVKKTVLPNGLTILTKPVTTNSIVSVVVALKMGTLYETDAEAGLTTLMQGTLRKGTATRTSEEIALELESMGTILSTSADREYGTVSMQSTSESLPASLDILFDLLTAASFPAETVDLQKNLQIQDIKATYDQPIYRAMDLMVEAQYANHPFHKPRFGYPETVTALTRDQVTALYQATYRPDNMVIVAVGNFDEKALIDTITERLGTIPKNTDVSRPSPVDPVRGTPVDKIETREGAASWFVMGWQAPKLTDDDYYAMEVLDSITGGSMNSRLFVAIREKRGLAYQVGSTYTARRTTGIYVAYIGTKPESYEESKSVLLDEVRSMGTVEVPAEELALAKSYLRGMHIMSQESNDGQAAQYALYELHGLGASFVDEYPAKINAVDAQTVMQAGKNYLTIQPALGAVLATIPQTAEEE